MILKLRQTPGLYLIGFMASGKTTIGKLLADRLGWSFADIDQDGLEENRIELSCILHLRAGDTDQVVILGHFEHHIHAAAHDG